MAAGGARRILLFRNGETKKLPLEYAYSKSKTRTFDRLLEDIDTTVTPRAQNYGRAAVGTKKLFTHEGQQIRTLDELDESTDNYFVVAGNEAFNHVPGGYVAILERAQKQSKPWQTLIGDQRSYIDLNKEKYGAATDREENQRLMNRLPKAQVMRFNVKHNEDQSFGPKTYIWRQKQTPTFESVCQDLDRLAPSNPPGQAIRQLIRESDGLTCKTVGDFVEGDTYVVVHSGEYRPTNADGTFLRRRGAPRQRSGSVDLDADGQPYDDAGDQYWSDDDLDDEQYTARYGKPQWYVPKPDDEIDWDEMKKRDDLMLQSHYSKRDLYGNVPSKIEQNSLTNLGDKRLFVFENGHGEEHRIIVLTKAQQARGINWTLKRLSVPFRINGKRICTMDGEKITSVEEIVHCGAYVVVPLGETFRHRWYYLPALAIDTSKDADNGGLSTAMKGREQMQNERRAGPDSAANRSNVGAAPAQRSGGHSRFTPRKPTNRVKPNHHHHAKHQRSYSASGRMDQRHHAPPQNGQRRGGQRGRNDRTRTVPNAGAVPLPPIDRHKGEALAHQQNNQRSVRKPLPYQNNVYKPLKSTTTKASTAPESQRRRDSWGDIIDGGRGSLSRSVTELPNINLRHSARNDGYKTKLNLERSYSEFDIKQQKPKRSMTVAQQPFRF